MTVIPALLAIMVATVTIQAAAMRPSGCAGQNQGKDDDGTLHINLDKVEI